jgi:archaellum component FlaC
MSKSERIAALEEQVSDLSAQINAYASSSHDRDKGLGDLIDKHFRETGQRLNAQNEINARWRSENDQRLAKVIENVDDRLTQMQSDINTLRQKVDGPDKRSPSVDPIDPGKPSDIEVVAERLAEVEDRLASLHLTERYAKVHDRIDKVAEIIGERVSGLVDQLEALARKGGSVEAEHSEKLDQHSRDIGRLLHLIFDEKPVPAFPTGGAHTLEGATEAVLPVPQRGDRVRLEGATNGAGKWVPDGWYDVVGSGITDGVPTFQVDCGRPDIDDAPRWLPWIAATHPGLKEVVHHG